MSERRIDELWRIAYGAEYLRLPRPKYRNEDAQAGLNSMSLRPHVRFARLIEAEVAAGKQGETR